MKILQSLFHAKKETAAGQGIQIVQPVLIEVTPGSFLFEDFFHKRRQELHRDNITNTGIGIFAHTMDVFQFNEGDGLFMLLGKSPGGMCGERLMFCDSSANTMVGRGYSSFELTQEDDKRLRLTALTSNRLTQMFRLRYANVIPLIIDQNQGSVCFVSTHDHKPAMIFFNNHARHILRIPEEFA